MSNNTPAPAPQELPDFNSPEVQAVYETLCGIGHAPPGEHWEGWVSRHIVLVLSKLRAPVADERVSLRGAANLAFNALHECKPAKGAEKQHSDAIQALQSALHDIAYTVNRTATPHQFADHLQREARAVLASAQVDPDAAEVDFMTRVLVDLEAWSTEEWSELLERRPAILALLRPMVMASAPVADTGKLPPCALQTVGWDGTGIAEYYTADQMRAAMKIAPVAGEAQPVAWLHQCRKKPELTQVTMKKHEPALAAKGFRPVPLYAATQASEAVRNAKDAERWRWATAVDDNAETLHSIVLCHGGDQQKINERADFYRTALSAQPGAQKNGSDAADAARYRLAVADCILILRGDAALGRAEWDSKLDNLAKAKGAA